MKSDYKPINVSIPPRQRRVSLKPGTVWTKCPNNGEWVEMIWLRVQGHYEYYSCPCGQEHNWAVR